MLCGFSFLCFVVSHANMVLNAEKRNKFVELVARRKAALANAGTSTLVNTPPAKGCFFGSVVVVW